MSVFYKNAVYKELIDYLSPFSAKEKENILAKMRIELLGDEEKIDTDSFFNWTQIREMANNGIEFDVHTCSHPILTNITYNLAKSEINDSISLVTTKINNNIPVFCYPNGKESDFDNYNNI